jgi:hypothetical protein
MKKIILSCLCFGLVSFSFAQALPVDDGHGHGKPATTTSTDDVLKLKQSEHNFDKIPQGKPVYYEFGVVNTGKTPLKLDNVQASCGCTTPEWSKDPIAPGATSIIKVGYNASAEGYFEKFITITYNTNQTKQLKITGTVWKAPDGSAPANASVDFLKKQTN